MGVGAIIGTGIFVVIGEGSRPDDISRAERCLPALKECAGRALA
ncbi:MAG: hypothetical protein AVDCRST_MAG29-1470 [uncultured Nocardioidaceae bacterium]|uniref:Uncharacterized protein n=1 Tax=uncultured Nocardioidaceae bacterium TaxID=253824 RepID=A0A6J4LRV6_9ACTN|nr:MAG: hypothetical protein AVDCRST_MAG29-1470 [uncultured Nocardioidaceae bacterium]